MGFYCAVPMQRHKLGKQHHRCEITFCDISHSENYWGWAWWQKGRSLWVWGQPSHKASSGQPNIETLSLKTKQTQKTKKTKAIKGRSEIIYSKSLTMLHSPIMALLGIAHYIERFQNVYETISHRRGGLAAPLKKAYSICKPWRIVNRKTQARSRKSL